MANGVRWSFLRRDNGDALRRALDFEGAEIGNVLLPLFPAQAYLAAVLARNGNN